jgi:hypothetical protein
MFVSFSVSFLLLFMSFSHGNIRKNPKYKFQIIISQLLLISITGR